MDYISHHGILGMKWGVRRYQNKDGSLTEAGKKKYKQISPDKLQKTLYKQVRSKRSEQTNWSNQWLVTNTIGPNSKAAQKKKDDAIRKYRETDKYKSAMKKINDLDREYNTGKITADQYDAQYEKIYKSVYKPELDSSVRIGNGRKYAQEFLDKYGSEINIGYLKDLGYSEDVSKWLNEKVMTANIKTIYGI